MKKIKVLIVLFLVIVLTGCSGTYNLKINEDLSIDENIDLTIPMRDGLYESTLRLFEKNKIPKDKYEVRASDKNVRIKYKESFDSLEEYLLESKIYKNMFDEINYTKDKNKLYISTKSALNLSGKKSNNMLNTYDISLLQINIETPYKVINTNSDSKDNNIMTWSLKNDTTYKKIDFTLDVNKKTTSYVQIIVLSLIGIITIAFVVVILLRIKKRGNI